MENSVIILTILAVVLIIVAILAVAIGYFWASSAAKADFLKQLKDQSDTAFRQSQEQLQVWKEQELNSIRQQIHDAAKGQVIQEMQGQMQKWQENELQQARQQMLEGIRGEAIQEAQEQLVKWRTDELENAKAKYGAFLVKKQLSILSNGKWKQKRKSEKMLLIKARL